MREVIPTFLDFERKILKAEYKIRNLLVWPVVRSAVFEELINSVNKKKGLAENTHKNKFNKAKLILRLKVLLRELSSFFDLFGPVEILVLSNEGKEFNLEGLKTNKLLWSLNQSVADHHNILVLNTQPTQIGNHKMKVVNISILLSLLSRLLQRINNKKVLNPVINFLDQEVNEYYGVTLDWNYIFQKNFNRQLVLSHIVKLIIKLKKPKLLIHTDNGSMNAVNKMAFNMNIETIDFDEIISNLQTLIGI